MVSTLSAPGITGNFIDAAARANLGLVLVLMGLNVVGTYGFLARAHIAHEVAGEPQVANRSERQV
jgi:hypothetical protein